MTITLHGMPAYPITTLLRDGSQVVFRPLVREDEKRLLDFFIRIPEVERYYLKEDVTSPDVIRCWTTDIDFDRVIPHDYRFFARGVEKMVVMGDDPAKEIADYARREKVDLIAIATHGRTGLARLTMGSVAGELLKARVAPLFMIRPDGLYYATSATDAT